MQRYGQQSLRSAKRRPSHQAGHYWNSFIKLAIERPDFTEGKLVYRIKGNEKCGMSLFYGIWRSEIKGFQVIRLMLIPGPTMLALDALAGKEDVPVLAV